MELEQTAFKVAGLNGLSLDCLSGEKPEFLAILCHGFGAPGTDLVPLAESILLQRPALQNKIRFICPEAPIDMANYGMPGGRAWWMIDMEALNHATATGEFRELENTSPEGMAEASHQLREMMDEFLKSLDLNYDKLFLSGFSQGSMICIKTLIDLPQSPAAMGLFSSTLLEQKLWREALKKHTGLKVMQSHGRQDPVLPFSLAEKLKGIMEESGMTVNFVPFDGGHEIPMPALQAYVDLLESL